MGKGRKYPKNNIFRHKANKILGEVATENSEPSLENPEDPSLYRYSNLGNKPVPVEKTGSGKLLDAFKYIGAAIAFVIPVFAFAFWVATLQSRVGVNENDISQLSKDGESSRKEIGDLKMSNIATQKDIGYMQKQLDSHKSKDSGKVNRVAGGL
jgi:hypothetical protein